MNSCNSCAPECCGGVSPSSDKKRNYESHILPDPATPYVFHQNNRYTMPHCHENMEILYFHGDGGIVCDRTTYDVHTHDIAIFDSNALHSIPLAAEVIHDCLIIDSGFLEKCDIAISKIKFNCVVIDETACKLYRDVANAISCRKNGADAFGAAAVKAAILSLMVYLCRNYSHSEAGESGHGDSVNRAIGYIKSHFDEPFTVDQIADSVNIRKYYFCREFHRETGFTVVGYINNLRCREAEKLLRDGKYTVGEVVRMCGFENLSYFTRTYKTIICHIPTASRSSGKQ